VIASACALSAALLSGCFHTIVGNGDEKTEPRDTGSFDAVESAGSVDVAVEVGASEEVSATCD